MDLLVGVLDVVVVDLPVDLWSCWQKHLAVAVVRVVQLDGGFLVQQLLGRLLHVVSVVELLHFVLVVPLLHVVVVVLLLHVVVVVLLLHVVLVVPSAMLP